MEKESESMRKYRTDQTHTSWLKENKRKNEKKQTQKAKHRILLFIVKGQDMSVVSMMGDAWVPTAE